MKIAIISSRFPYPIEKGDKLRLYHQMRILSKEHELYLFAVCEKEPTREDYQKLEPYCQKIHHYLLPRSRRFGKLIGALSNELPFQVAYFTSQRIKSHMHKDIASYDVDAVYCQLIRAAEYAKDLPHYKILDYMDAMSVISEREAEVSKGMTQLFREKEADRSQLYEQTIRQYFDKATVISEHEKTLIKTERPLSVVGNGVDTDFFQSEDVVKTYDIGFFGNLGYPPNIIAAFRLVNIANSINESSTKVNLLITGARPPKGLLKKNSDSITVKGWVKDIRKSYDLCKILVAPIDTGSGQQNKVLEAMAMGLPCITTTQVNQAIGAEPGKEVMLADSDKEFERAIGELLKNQELINEMSKNGRALVKRSFSWQVEAEALSKLFSLKTNKSDT